MTEKQIIREFLISLTNKNIQFEDDDSLLTAKLLDSLEVIELIVFLEDHYQVTFDDDELTPENLDTINAIVNLLEQKRAS